MCHTHRMACVICLETDDKIEHKGCCCRGDSSCVHAKCVIEHTSHLFSSCTRQEWYTKYCRCDVCKHLYTGPLFYKVSQYWYDMFKNNFNRQLSVDTRSMYVIALSDNKEYEEAIRLQSSVIEDIQLMHVGSLVHIDASMRLCQLYLHARQHDEAMMLLHKIMALEETTQPSLERKLKCMRILSKIYMQQKRRVRAKMVIEDIIAAEHSESINIYNKNVLVTILMNMRRFAEAICLADDILVSANRIYGPEHPITREVMRHRQMAAAMSTRKCKCKSQKLRKIKQCVGAA